uniref:UDP-glucuronosyltransferase n=1 Tax=Panagrellus redivivus TaxID=6233 RepID=A0A7E4ULK0_PANRE
MKAPTFFVFALLGVLTCSATKVVVYNPFFMHSHFSFMLRLTNLLAEDGHNVTMIIPEIPEGTKVALSPKARLVIRSTIKQDTTVSGEVDQHSMWNMGYEAWDSRAVWHGWIEDLEAHCERLLTDKAFIKEMLTEKFEFGLIEAADYCGYGFFMQINVTKYVNQNPMALSEKVALALGLPGNIHDHYPASLGHHPSLTFFERLSNFIGPIVRNKLHNAELDGFSAHVVRKHVDPNFHAFDAIANGRYLFINTEEHMDFPRPISHKVVYIGGITVSNDTVAPLPEDYADIFDTAKQGVVYISFGTLAQSKAMPPSVRNSFLAMFAAFPEINFLWKYENPDDTIASDLPNVFKRKWVPQKEVLTHPKLLAFITHGGMNSVIEGAYAGVPMIGIPMFCDQRRNVKMLQFRKSLIVIEKTDITPDNLIDSLNALISTDVYSRRAKEIATIAKSKPFGATERFLAYFRHAVAFSNSTDYLDIRQRKHDVITYYNLDVYGFVTFVIAIALFLVFMLISFICKALLSHKNDKKNV